MVLPPPGTIMMTAIGYNPVNWLYCNGAEMNIDDFPALFDILGNKHGGNKDNGTFNLPTLAPPAGTADIEYIIATGEVARLFTILDEEKQKLNLVGSVFLIDANSAMPAYAHYCDGSVIDIETATGLFSLLSIKYGGDGVTTFAVPDCRAAEKDLNGQRFVIITKGIFPPRW